MGAVGAVKGEERGLVLLAVTQVVPSLAVAVAVVEGQVVDAAAEAVGDLGGPDGLLEQAGDTVCGEVDADFVDLSGGDLGLPAAVGVRGGWRADGGEPVLPVLEREGADLDGDAFVVRGDVGEFEAVGVRGPEPVRGGGRPVDDLPAGGVFVVCRPVAGFAGVVPCGGRGRLLGGGRVGRAARNPVRVSGAVGDGSPPVGTGRTIVPRSATIGGWGIQESPAGRTSAASVGARRGAGGRAGPVASWVSARSAAVGSEGTG